MIKNATAAPNVRQQPQEEPCRSVVCVLVCVCVVWLHTTISAVVVSVWGGALDSGAPVLCQPQIQRHA
jgi:hypothetical protein